jgi:putative iron-only hydrogenase system regulator
LHKENPNLRRRTAVKEKENFKKMEKRLAGIFIILKKGTDVCRLNSLLSGFAPLIISRQGINMKNKTFSIISLVVEATNEEIGAFTGRLGKLEGVKVKTASIKPDF